MKPAIDKKLKKALLSVIGIIIILLSLLLFKSIKYPGFKEEKKPTYSYSNTAGVDYKAILKPNTFYPDGTVLGQGDIIFSELLDNLKINFKYQFSGERPADIKGDYEVIAVLEGTLGSEKDQKTLWQKTFPLLPKQGFESKDKTAAFEKEVSVKLDKYKAYAQSFASASKVESQVKLSIMMNVNLKASTDSGVINKTLSPAISIPLNANYFEITKNVPLTKPEALQKSERVQQPVNKKNVTALSVIIGILLLAFMYIGIFTKGTSKDNLREKEMKKIFKNHGDRLVALSDSISFDCDYYYKVRSIEDLVRVSDELGRPIMYKHDEDINNITQFYVCDNKSRYVFNINEFIQSLMVEKVEVKNENTIGA